MSCGRLKAIPSQEDDGPREQESEYFQEDRYTLQEMTPDMVHFGSIPELVVAEEIENVRRIVDSELTGSHDAQTLRALIKVCENAMKQYRRTRPEASTQGKRRAREILEGKKDETGKRVGKGRIPCHPVLREVELKRMRMIGTNAHHMDELKQREEFLLSLSNFRPKETVLEAFVTGGGKEVGVHSHIDKGRTTQSAKKNDLNLALSAMKGMRREMKIARDKSATLIVAGSQDLQTNQFTGLTTDTEDHRDSNHIRFNKSSIQVENGNVRDDDLKDIDRGSKIKISKAVRRKMKKNPNERDTSYFTNFQSDKTKLKRGSDFRDEAYYIDHDSSKDKDTALRSLEIEKAMQPSSSTTKDSFSSAMKLEEAILDIVGDENVDLVQQHRINRWDKSKRKYVQTTLGSELSGDSKSKKIRLESGQSVKKDKMKLGDLYEKWQRKTNKSVGRVGVFDDEYTGTGQGTRIGKVENADSHKIKAPVDGERNAVQIKKQREAEKKMRLKNMKRVDRRRLEGKVRAERNKRAADKTSMKKKLVPRK